MSSVPRKRDKEAEILGSVIRFFSKFRGEKIPFPCSAGEK